MGKFMNNFTLYNSQGTNKNDDAPDSLALFTAETIIGLGLINKVIPLDRKEYGI